MSFVPKIIDLKTEIGMFLPPIIIIIIIIIIEFLTYQLWLENIHLPWDVVIDRIRLGWSYL